MHQEETLDLNIDGIMNDINGKADKDLLNVTDSGYSVMAGAGMPSTTYDELTLGATGSTYTAPANGYFAFDKIAASSSQYVALVLKDGNTEVMKTKTIAAASSQPIQCFIPVKKGNTVAAVYTASSTTNFFRFIYAVGSESEAQ